MHAILLPIIAAGVVALAVGGVYTYNLYLWKKLDYEEYERNRRRDRL